MSYECVCMGLVVIEVLTLLLLKKGTSCVMMTYATYGCTHVHKYACMHVCTLKVIVAMAMCACT